GLEALQYRGVDILLRDFALRTLPARMVGQSEQQKSRRVERPWIAQDTAHPARGRRRRIRGTRRSRGVLRTVRRPLDARAGRTAVNRRSLHEPRLPAGI